MLRLVLLFCATFVSSANCQEFSPPVIVSDPTLIASSHQMAMNCSGKAIIVWVSTDLVGPRTIQASVYNRKSKTWSAPVILEAAEINAGVASPQVAINAKGQAIAVWPRSISDQNTIRYATFSDNTWSEAQTLFSTFSEQIFASFPQVGIDSEGNAEAIWVVRPSSGDDPNRVLASHFDGSVWSMPTVVDSVTFIETPPSLAVNSKGQALAVWQAVDGATTSIRASSLVDGQWASAITLDTLVDLASPKVAIDRKGNGVAIWNTVDTGDISSIHASSFIDGQWLPFVTVASGDAATALFSQHIALDDFGNGVAVWHGVNSDDEIFTIQAAIYHNHQWQAPVIIASATNPNDVLNPNIGLNREGDGAAVWFAITNFVKTVQLRSYKNGAWSDSIIDVGTLTAPSLVNSNPPIVKADSCGHLIVSWIAIAPAPGRTSVFAAVGD